MVALCDQREQPLLVALQEVLAADVRLAEQFARVEHDEVRARAGVRELVPGDVLQDGTWGGWEGTQGLRQWTERRGGEGRCGHGASDPIAIHCGKTAGKLRWRQQPSLAMREQHFWTVADGFPLHRTARFSGIKITMQLKHEVKAADVVIHFVLTLGDSATL